MVEAWIARAPRSVREVTAQEMHRRTQTLRRARAATWSPKRRHGVAQLALTLALASACIYSTTGVLQW